MNVIRIDQNNPDPGIIASAVKYLLDEEVIVHPTETVYGLAGLFCSRKAIEKIIEAKSRSASQPFSIMVNDTREMLSISGQKADWLQRMLERIFPAPVTVLLPRLRKIKPDFWNQFPLLGFRYPNHPLSNRLLDGTGRPIVSTSANLSGQPAVNIPDDLPSSFLSAFPLVLDGGETPEKKPSTIIRIDVKKKTAQLIRSGAVPWALLEKHIAEDH